MYGVGADDYAELVRKERERKAAMTHEERVAENLALFKAEQNARAQRPPPTISEDAKEYILPALKDLESNRHKYLSYSDTYSTNTKNNEWKYFSDPRVGQGVLGNPTITYLLKMLTNQRIFNPRDLKMKIVKPSGWFSQSNKLIITNSSSGKMLAFKSLRGDKTEQDLYNILDTLGVTKEATASGGYKSRRNRNKKRRSTRKTRATRKTNASK